MMSVQLKALQRTALELKKSARARFSEHKVPAMQKSSEIYFYFFAHDLIERELLITMNYFLFFFEAVL